MSGSAPRGSLRSFAPALSLSLSLSLSLFLSLSLAFGPTRLRSFLRDFEIVGDRLHNRLTDTFPLVLHCPGESRFQREFDRLAALGWAAPVLRCDDD